MAFYSYLTVLMVHIGMEAMHCAGSPAHWTTMNACTHPGDCDVKGCLTGIWIHMHCTHKHAFTYAYACNKYAYGAGFPNTHTQGRSGTLVQSGPCCSESVWSCLTVLAIRRLSEVKHTHLPQNLNMINTDRNRAEWKLDLTEMNQIDSEGEGRTRFRGTA